GSSYKNQPPFLSVGAIWSTSQNCKVYLCTTPKLFKNNIWQKRIGAISILFCLQNKYRVPWRGK
ncbi:MAG: hypothetical protein QM483_09575, partial [Desulfuromusa sp.]